MSLFQPIRVFLKPNPYDVYSSRQLKDLLERDVMVNSLALF